ncbi:hypothetical protein [Actinopolymorpha alba]|uniref:hypothetical protein n=1 Tax=Actinopolymorpha alba TaxID=533267 RepID=UPI00036AC561|nr:hypothetical protein [Actinopolymorpha alba]
MRVLLVESTPGAGGGVRERLEAAGHATVTCPGGIDCSLVGAGHCPLVDEAVDVVVDVRARPEPFTVHEQPLVCGILAGVPTVVCGPIPQMESARGAETPGPPVEGAGRDSGPDSGPVGIWRRADVRCAPEGILEAVDEATLPTSRTVRHRIATAVNAVLRPRGLAGPFRVDVTTRRGVVDVHLEFAGRVPPPAVREQLRTVVRAALIPVTRAWASATVLIFEGAPTAERQVAAS